MNMLATELLQPSVVLNYSDEDDAGTEESEELGGGLGEDDEEELGGGFDDADDIDEFDDEEL